MVDCGHTGSDVSFLNLVKVQNTYWISGFVNDEIGIVYSGFFWSDMVLKNENLLNIKLK